MHLNRVRQTDIRYPLSFMRLDKKTKQRVRKGDLWDSVLQARDVHDSDSWQELSGFLGVAIVLSQ